jgi:predicted secreted protein
MTMIDRWLGPKALSRILGLTLLAAVAVAHGSSNAKAEPIVVQANQSTTVELDGNSSTGYSWRLDNEASENTKLVTIDDLGYVKRELAPGQRPVLGAPSKYQFKVTGVEVGTARLVFAYARGDEPPAKTQEVSIEVMGE